MTRVALIAVSLVALLTATPAAQSSGARLQHLDGVEELKTWFNTGKGHPRLIFLLSPT